MKFLLWAVPARLTSVQGRAGTITQIAVSGYTLVCCFISVVRCPNRFTHKKTHGLDVKSSVHRETMVDTSWKNYQIAFLYLYPDPTIVQVADVKVSTTV